MSSRTSTLRDGFAVLAVAIRREPWVFTLSTLGSVLFGALTVADAWVLGWSTQHAVLPAFENGEISSAILWAVLGLFVGVALLRAVGIVARRLGAGVMQYRMQAHYRRAVTRQYLTLPMEWHQRHPTGPAALQRELRRGGRVEPDRAAADGRRHGGDAGHRDRPDAARRRGAGAGRDAGLPGGDDRHGALPAGRLAADDPGPAAARRGQRDRPRVLRRRHGRQDPRPRGRGDRAVRRQGPRAARRVDPGRPDPRDVRPGARPRSPTSVSSSCWPSASTGC